MPRYLFSVSNSVCFFHMGCQALAAHHVETNIHGTYLLKVFTVAITQREESTCRCIRRHIHTSRKHSHRGHCTSEDSVHRCRRRQLPSQLPTLMTMTMTM